ncbi:MAG: hypothetical protein IPN95_17635 [Bacteroidetes bacterium]|nr:hypothetical protein [Bacteroidota bacterium]
MGSYYPPIPQRATSGCSNGNPITGATVITYQPTVKATTPWSSQTAMDARAHLCLSP